jgi:chemotaxis signal transduction protein
MSTSGAASDSRGPGSYLLLRAGDYVCALPLGAVRRVVRALTVHPLPGASGELLGLAEFGGEPLAVLDLARLVRAAPGANPACPVTVVVWIGPPESREAVGLAADAALEVVEIPAAAIAGGAGSAGGDIGLVAGEAPVGEQVVRVLSLEALGGAG